MLKAALELIEFQHSVAVTPASSFQSAGFKPSFGPIGGLSAYPTYQTPMMGQLPQVQSFPGVIQQSVPSGKSATNCIRLFIETLLP